MSDLSITRRGDELVLEICVPRLIADTADRLKAAMKAAITAERAVMIDLRHVEFIDSSGIGSLVSIRKHLGETGELRLCNPRHFVAKVLRLTRIDQAIPVVGPTHP